MSFEKLNVRFVEKLEGEITASQMLGEPLDKETAKRLLEGIREFLTLTYGDEDSLLEEINSLVVEAFNNKVVSKEFIPFAADEVFKDYRHIVK